MRHRLTLQGLGLLVLVALGGTGCAVDRKLSITSDPPGASVRLDDEIIGLTPLVLDFDSYGRRRITLYREDYRTYSKRVAIKPPWHLRFPLDLVSEVLLPFGWKDHHFVHVELEPEPAEVMRSDVNPVLLRADLFRRAGPEGPNLREIEDQATTSQLPAPQQ